MDINSRKSPKYKYSSIRLAGNFDRYFDESEQELKEFSSLSSINVIVGSNNAGKSRFLREIIRIKDLEFKISSLNMESVTSKIKEIETDINEIALRHNNVASFRVGSTPTQQTGTLKLIDPIRFFNEKYFKEKPLIRALDTINHFKNDKYSMESYRGSHDIGPFETEVKRYIGEQSEALKNLDEFTIDEVRYRKFYIPTLRSLNFFGQGNDYLKEDPYKKRIINTYGLNEEELDLTVFTGLGMYSAVRSMLLGDTDERKKISQYEKFLSTELFNGQDVSLIPKEKSDVLHIKIGDEERAIYDLGDGIQSLIILTFPMFETDNALFFIEEPEMHLHPGLQRKLIEVMKTMRGHQFFITTHSNHFLDLTLDYSDTSIYTFQKKDNKTIIKIVSQADENILQLLGARNSSVFLSNSTIWVEGITDRLYIRKFLELYQKDKDEKIQEDIDYSFVEYGGDNITHWSFLSDEDNPINIQRLCGKSFLITDKDGDKNIERKELLQQNLGERYHLLDCNEIENILSIKTIEKVLHKYEKKNNFSIPAFRSTHPHKDIRIGKFIEEKIFSSQTMKRKGGYQEKSGTIKNKVDFCKKAIEDMSHDELSPMAMELSKKIYNFVIDQKE
jgi:predicted ATP-dependent endonuclease of OLD family